MDNKGASMVKIVAAILVVIAVGWIIWAIVDDKGREETASPANDQTQNQPESELSKVVDNPENYYKKQVTVEGEVQDVYTNRVFKISDEAIGDELLVITKEPLTAEQAAEAEELLGDNANVKVQGTVRELVLADIEREFDLDLSPELEVEFRNKPVLVADNVRFSDKGSFWDFDTAVRDVQPLPDVGD